ncbi:MAG: ABC transporter permease [Acidobacteria bacterium]|nr:ABC transporter permease [Acidobacteriota bacterium]
MIPLRYNIGSLWVRRTGTMMAVLGIGLTVSIVVTMMELVHGLESTFVDTGQEDNLIVIRQGGLNEVNSYFGRDVYPTVRFLPGIAKGADGEPLVVGEAIVIINHTRDNGQPSNMLVRGTSAMGFYLRPEVRIVEGRRFRPGLREVNVSRSLSNRFQNLKLGDSIRMSRSDWKVVGIFDAGGTAYDSELWASYEEICQDWDRAFYSSILLKAESAEAAESIRKRIADDQRIHLQAVPQRKYYQEQTSASVGIKGLGYFIAVVMGIGASFAAMNMMYGAVMSRSKEVATLRSLGFRRRHILASFMMESILVGLAGGILGCLLALPIHGVSTGTASFQSLSEILFNFRITPEILFKGLLFATLVGALGGFLPARRAARMRLMDIMKE